MKKEWQKPRLEVLDVKMTMANPTGGFYDANYVQNAPHQDDQWNVS